jgi:cyclin B
MARQPDINGRMRSILVDWLVDVGVKFRLQPQTLFLATNVIDRYLSKNQVQRNILQLVGITALMVVCKFEEIYPPQCQKYVAVCDNAYTKEQIIEMEARLLQSLEFDLTQTSALTFLQHLQLRLPIDAKAFAFARYILENSLLDTLHLKYSNFTLAAGAIYLVNKIFKCAVKRTAFEEATLVDESGAKACAKELHQIMQSVDKSNLTALKRKFATPELFETSNYRIERVQPEA